MNSQEQDCARELLSGLHEADLIELSKTVTKGNFSTPTNKQEALDLVLRYETDVRSLLNRKKVSTNLLRHYLHFKNVRFSVEETKHSLCDTIINFWRSSSGLGRSITSGEGIKAKTASPQDIPLIESSIPQQNVSDPISTLVPTGLTSSDIDLLGSQFIAWFYSMIRGPDLQLIPVDPIHFFSDASSRVVIRPQDVREGTGGEGCASVLTTALKDVGDAVPLANEASVRSETSACGAVKVLACGTLHARPSLVLGSFEQAFLLVRDPSATDNWKVKFTELRIKTSRLQPDPRTLPDIDNSHTSAIEYFS